MIIVICLNTVRFFTSSVRPGVGCTKAGYSAIHWIAIFSTFVKLAVDRYNLRLRFGIYKLKFLRSIVG